MVRAVVLGLSQAPPFVAKIARRSLSSNPTQPFVERFSQVHKALSPVPIIYMDPEHNRHGSAFIDPAHIAAILPSLLPAKQDALALALGLDLTLGFQFDASTAYSDNVFDLQGRFEIGRFGFSIPLNPIPELAKFVPDEIQTITRLEREIPSIVSLSFEGE
jgi:hypothetical protein